MLAHSHKLPRFEAANDKKARPVPRRISVIITAHEPHHVLNALVGFFLAVSLVMVALTYGFLYEGTKPTRLYMAPLASAQIPLQKIKKEIRKPVSAPTVKKSDVIPAPKTEPAPTPVLAAPLPFTPLPTPTIQDEAQPVTAKQAEIPLPEMPTPLTDIVLPAPSLEAADTHADAAETASLADKIARLPVMKDNSAPSISIQGNDETESLLAEADKNLQAGQLDQARRLYKAILGKNKFNHEALTGYIFALARDEKIEEAISMSRKLLVLYAHDDKAEANLSHLLSEQGKTREAITYLDRAARDAPYNLDYRLDLATLYDRDKQPTKALMLYRQVVEAAEKNGNDALPVDGIRKRIAYLETLGIGAPSPSTIRPLATK